jgi:predicted aspartyl protease/thioredoxin-like negative regulator of GroEL
MTPSLPNRPGSLGRNTPLGILLVLALLAAQAFAAKAQIPGSAERTFRQADRYFRQANYAEAEKLFRAVIAAEPDNKEAKLRLAHVLVKRRQIGEAYDISFAIAKEDPKNAYAIAVVATALLGAGDFATARPLFLRALELDKREALAWVGIGMIDYYENRIDDGLLKLREAVFHEPNHADYIFSLAQVSARAEYYKEAADAYQRFLDLAREPDDDRRARIRGLITFLRFLGDKVSLYSAAGAASTTVPFELIGNRPVLKVRINGKGEQLNFILDTGSGITVLSEEAAAKMKVNAVTRGGYAKGVGGDGKFEIVYGFLRQLDIGSVRVRSVPVYIRRFHSLNYKVDGYIGLAVISKFLTTVDYGDLTFKLERRENPPEVAAADARSLPLRLTSSGFLSGEVQLDGLEQPQNFIVDTGASISVISTALAGEKAISDNELDEKMRVVGAAGITEGVRSFKLPKLSFGRHSRSEITAVALDLDLINEASGFEQAGILGGNFLKSYRLTFDFKNSRVTFEPVTERPSETVTPLE